MKKLLRNARDGKEKEKNAERTKQHVRAKTWVTESEDDFFLLLFSYFILFGLTLL